VLAVEVGVFHTSWSKIRKMADTLAAQPFTNLAADAAGTDQDARRLREARLAKSGDQFLPVRDREARIGRRH